MYRCYNGCPDSALKAKWDEEARLVCEMQKLLPTASWCYYPVEGKYMCWNNDGYVPIVDEMFDTKNGAVLAAIAKLKETL